MDKTKPCKVFRAKSVIGIVLKIFIIMEVEVGMINAFYDVVMSEEAYSKQMNAGVICIAYFIRIIGIVAGSLVLQKVKKRENDLLVAMGINALTGIVATFVFLGMIAGEEIKMIMDPDDAVASILALALWGAIGATLPAFCSIALFDWRESVKSKKKKKKGIYIPASQKLDI